MIRHFNYFLSINEGDLNNSSTPVLLFGKAMTSLMLGVLNKTDKNRSQPMANPEWGGHPFLNTCRRWPNNSSCFFASMFKNLLKI